MTLKNFIIILPIKVAYRCYHAKSESMPIFLIDPLHPKILVAFSTFATASRTKPETYLN